MSERIPRPPGYHLWIQFGYSELGEQGGEIIQYRAYQPVHSHGPELIHVVSIKLVDGERAETLEDVIHPASVQYHNYGPPNNSRRRRPSL